MRILGIDPGYERLGIAIMEKRENKDFLVYSECFQTSKNIDFHERLLLIGNRIEEIIKTHRPDTLAIETLMFNTNQKTAMNVAEARGVVLFQAIKNKLSVFEYTPLQIKIAITGYGRSDKNQVTEMVKRLVKTPASVRPLADYGAARQTKPNPPPSPKATGGEVKDDEYDAIACAITCFASYKVQNINIEK